MICAENMVIDFFSLLEKVSFLKIQSELLYIVYRVSILFIVQQIIFKLLDLAVHNSKYKNVFSVALYHIEILLSGFIIF